MNVVELRRRSRQFAETINGEQTPAIQHFRNIISFYDEMFVWELYRQLLEREPDDAGFHAHLGLLRGGASKNDVIADILGSPEMGLQLSQPESNPGGKFTICGVFRRLVHRDETEFVKGLYRELLHREPAGEECQIHIGLLHGGMTRQQMINGMFQTPECQLTLQHLQPNASAPPYAGGKQIGLFLGLTQRVNLDGEGIGRYSVRLTEGLLKQNDTCMIHVFSLEHNLPDMTAMFRQFKQAYPERLFFRSFPNMEWLNRHAEVDAWIVPYAGIELAAQLERPYAVVLHDLVYIHFFELYMSKDPGYVHFMEQYAKPVLYRAARVVTSSYFVREREGLQYLKLPPEKLAVIRLAAPDDEYRSAGLPDEAAFRHKYGLYGSYITFPSAIRLHKNHLRLIEAFLNYKSTPEGAASGLQLALTDHFTAAHPLRPEFDALMARGYSPEAVHSLRILGRLQAEDLPALYKYAMGTIVPTEFEGSCPFPILESLSLGTPVAISRIDVALEVIANIEPFITFHPHLVHEIQAAIHELVLRHREVLGRQQDAIRGALNRSWSNVASEFYALINSM